MWNFCKYSCSSRQVIILLLDISDKFEEFIDVWLKLCADDTWRSHRIRSLWRAYRGKLLFTTSETKWLLNSSEDIYFKLVDFRFRCTFAMLNLTICCTYRLHRNPSGWGRDTWMWTSVKRWARGLKNEPFFYLQFWQSSLFNSYTASIFPRCQIL